MDEDLIELDNDGSYTFNNYAQNPSVIKGPHGKEKFWRKFQPRNGDEVPLFCDGAWVGISAMMNDNAPVWDGQMPNLSYVDNLKRVCLDRHNMKINVVFLDASVRKVPLKELWSLRWHKKWDPRTLPPDGWPQWMDE